MSQYDKTTEALIERELKKVLEPELEEVLIRGITRGRASAKESLEIAVRALENIRCGKGSNSHNFNTACEALAAIKERGDYP